MTTLLKALQQAAATTPEKPAFICGGQVLRYRELHARVATLATALQQRLGLRPGDRVLVIGANDPGFVIAVYAVWWAGGTAVPVNPTSTADDLAYLAADSGARLALVQDAVSLPALTGASAFNAVTWSETAKLAADARPADLPMAPSASELCLLPYTSGTTGRPKGCMHSQATLSASLRSSARWRGFTAETVFLGNTPLFHMQGFQNGMNLPLMLGATSVLQPRWQAEEAATLIERHRVSAWSAAPTMLIDFFASPAALARDLKSLRLVSGGGAALPSTVAHALRDRLGLVYNEAYGMTETASFLHANPVNGGHAGCLGLATDGVDSRIVDPATGAALPDGEVGELITHAPQVMAQYWTAGLQPRANDGAFWHIDGKRFLRTGDLALRDAEGYFFLRDRLKRMINSAGFKVWPAEVEALLHQHPAVQEACVIAMHDARRGEAVKAVIVTRPGSALREQDLIDWARDAMAHYKAPKAVEFRDHLPRSATGKTAWRELQQQQRELDALLTLTSKESA